MTVETIEAIEQPTLWTKHGTMLQSELRHAPKWEDHPGAIVFVDEWFHGDESVHRAVHVLSKFPMTAEGAAAPI